MTVLDLITKHEGSEASPYNDSRGIPTVGVGHNLQAHPLPGEVYPMSPDRITAVLASDLQAVVDGLTAALPWFNDLDPVRQAVLLDMAFNMGVQGLLKWPNTLRLIQTGDYAGAAVGMLNSLWARQVGRRASEDAYMMQTGVWPGTPAP